MKNLNELAKEYKKTKSQGILNQIFKMLEKVLKKKANYLFQERHFGNIRLCETKLLELEDLQQE